MGALRRLRAAKGKQELPITGPRPQRRTGPFQVTEKEVDAPWAVPFPFADASIVKRSMVRHPCCPRTRSSTPPLTSPPLLPFTVVPRWQGPPRLPLLCVHHRGISLLRRPRVVLRHALWPSRALRVGPPPAAAFSLVLHRGDVLPRGTHRPSDCHHALLHDIRVSRVQPGGRRAARGRAGRENGCGPADLEASLLTPGLSRGG